MVPILHDRGKYWTIWAETFRVHTNFSRRFQWKHSGRPQTLDLTQTASQIFWIFGFLTTTTTPTTTKNQTQNPNNLRWCLSQIKGLGPSGVLPLESPRKMSMNAESFSPYSPIFVPIAKNRYQNLVRNPILGLTLPHPHPGMKKQQI